MTWGEYHDQVQVVGVLFLVRVAAPEGGAGGGALQGVLLLLLLLAHPGPLQAHLPDGQDGVGVRNVSGGGDGGGRAEVSGVYYNYIVTTTATSVTSTAVSKIRVSGKIFRFPTSYPLEGERGIGMIRSGKKISERIFSCVFIFQER